MKTLYRYDAPKGVASVRLVERQTYVPPTPERPASQRRGFAVILDLPGQHAAFVPFHDMEYAASAFAVTCHQFGCTRTDNMPVFVP
jgi:hypothetical protein